MVQIERLYVSYSTEKAEEGQQGLYHSKRAITIEFFCCFLVATGQWTCARVPDHCYWSSTRQRSQPCAKVNSVLRSEPINQPGRVSLGWTEP
jgi:hypothetical protein